MEFPTPLITGTLVFALITFLLSLVGLYLRRTKTWSKDESQLWCVSIIVGTICCWIMWICTWLHQWHPLIVPIAHPHAEAKVPGGAGGGGGGGH